MSTTTTPASSPGPPAPVTDELRPNEVALLADAVTLKYGEVTALRGVSFTVRSNEVMALVGPNGAGKTSMFNCISAFARPSSGRLEYRGLDLTKATPHDIASFGVARMFQNLSLFPGATVMENVLVGRHRLMRSSVVQNLLMWRRSRREDRLHREAVADVLNLLDLFDLRNVPAGTLSYGTRKRVELARALASEPSLLLMDEPAAGMNPTETAELTEIIARIRANYELSILIVEHDMSMIMKVADWITVLDFGEVIAQGRPEDIQKDQRVRDAYLGSFAASTTGS